MLKSYTIVEMKVRAQLRGERVRREKCDEVVTDALTPWESSVDPVICFLFSSYYY
jgi:hypothetical protein